MIIRRVARILALTTAIAALAVSTASAETLTRGNYICVEYKHRPGYYKETLISELVSDGVGVAVGGAAAAAGGGNAGAVAVGGTARYVVKKILEWVPASTTCLKWEHGSRMDGNQYQY